MNACRATACIAKDWRRGLPAAFSGPTASGGGGRCPWASQTRSQTTGEAEKPRPRAIDLAQRVRERERAKARPGQAAPSAQQKRVSDLKRFSAQLQHVHPNVLAKQLLRGLLHQDEHVVVLNKPYGVPVRDDTGAASICSVLPVLSKMMSGNKIKSDIQLLPCLGLEKEAAGALLLAKRADVVENMLDFQRNNEVQMTYWAITVGVPVPSEGVIDIPVIEREVTGPQPHYKMALSPLFKMNETGDGLTKVRAHRQAHPAVTKYRVLDSSCGCSLVELQPLTGAKHQMRVHMAFGLTCPILGDHKYSHWNKLAPQKLPERVLKKLGLEQSKSRHLPLHLLARRLTLPGVDGADVSVSCPAPKYFTKTSNLLQLMLPFKEERD